MSSLHIISTAPTAGSALADCLRAADRDDTVLLTRDGVYAAMAGAAAPAGLLDAAVARGIVLYALLPDVDARGLAGLLRSGCNLVDDNGFVALTERHPRILSWF